MDFKDAIKQISDRIVKLKGNLETEEATKNALVMPFLNALGYDVFNPLEVLPEMTCDIGTKKGEKIDYAILKDGQPVMLIECKHWAQDLNLHDNQLLRYFNVSPAKFGVLTNGIVYRFYTDLESPNKMDSRPFLEVNLLDLRDNHIEELKKFHKSAFDVDSIMSSANELKYTGEIKTLIAKEFTSPSLEFAKFFGRQVYDGMYTARVAEQFVGLVKRSISSYISEMISDRLKAAIKDNEEGGQQQPEKSIEEPVRNDGIETTQEEMEGFYIVRAILCDTVDITRVTHRDAKSYFAILFDDNNRRPICRLHFNTSQHYIETFDLEKVGTRHPIEGTSDIYKYSDDIKKVVKYYLDTDSSTH